MAHGTTSVRGRLKRKTMTYHHNATGLSSRVKHVLVSASGRAVRRGPLRGVGEKFFAGRTSIIHYHGIWPKRAPQLPRFKGIDIDAFYKDLKKLAAFFEFVNINEILKYNADDVAKFQPVLTVCFDDGCDMIRTGAADVLDSFRVPATVFVITACVGNRHLMWTHKLQAVAVTRGVDRLIREYNSLMAKTGAGPRIGSLGELPVAAWSWPMQRKEEFVDCLYRACDMPPVEEYLDEYRPYMTWDELRDWIGRGHQVGLHTRSHPSCDRLAASDLPDEIVAPAEQLRRELGLDALPFAYPFGNRLSRESEARVCREAGLSCMLGVGGLSPRGTDPRRLDRVSGEAGLDWSLFGKPVLKALLPARGSPGGRRASDGTPPVR